MGVPIEVTDLFGCGEMTNSDQWTLISLKQFLLDLRKHQRSAVAVVRRSLVLLLGVVVVKEMATTMFFDKLSR